MRKTSWIFKFCAGGALGISAAAYMAHETQESELRHDATERALAQGMMRDFMKCSQEKIAEQSAGLMMPPVIDIARQFGAKDGWPTLNGGALRIETSLPDYIQGGMATMVTEIDRDKGKVTKFRYNYVGSIHEAQHEIILRATSACLNAHGPMA